MQRFGQLAQQAFGIAQHLQHRTSRAHLAQGRFADGGARPASSRARRRDLLIEQRASFVQRREMMPLQGTLRPFREFDRLASACSASS